MKNIKFFTTEDLFSAIPHPEPAKKFLPDWYKKMSAKIPEEIILEKPNKNMKMCFGITDAFSYGYIIPSFCDFNLHWENENLKIETNWEDNFISSFSSFQYKEYDFPEDHVRSMIKITLPWRIETSINTSIFVCKPKWRNLNYEIYEGIVDSDKYVNHIHLIMSFGKKDKVIIKRGDPLVQIIPLVVNDWESEIKIWTQKEELRFKRQQNTVSSYFYGGYKKHFWKQKKFK